MTHRVDLDPLIERSAAGDERAFAALYDATSARVFGLLNRMLGPRRAEEVAQEVYVSLWRSADRFDPARGSAWSWIALVARSRAVDRLRADRSYEGAIDDLEATPDAVPVGNPGGNPVRDAVERERTERIRSALAALPDDQRETLERAFFEGLTHREIAEASGTPLGTVKGRVRLALEKLREGLSTGVES